MAGRREDEASARFNFQRYGTESDPTRTLGEFQRPSGLLCPNGFVKDDYRGRYEFQGSESAMRCGSDFEGIYQSLGQRNKMEPTADQVMTAFDMFEDSRSDPR